MLLEFRVENYRCIAEEQALLLSASRDDSLRDENVIPNADGRGLDLIKSAVLYGANGAGKSTLVRAASLVRHLVLASATGYQAGDALPIEPFRLDAELAASPSTFELSFLHRGVRYQYGFKADRERVHDEWLLAYPEGRAQTWFQREGWRFGPNLKGEKKRIADLTRDNALFLSSAANLNHPQLSSVFAWFKKNFRILAPGLGLRFPRPGEESSGRFTARWALEDEGFRAKVTELLRQADIGITGIEVKRKRLDDDELPEDLPEEIKKEILETEFERVRTLHQGNEGTGGVWFELGDESDGTQDLFDLAGPWLDTIASGYTLLVDEVFANLHPLLTRQLLIGFHKSQHAGTPAQAILTTHDTSLLDPKIMRRDQVWFVEKTPTGSSHFYSLLDYKPRKGEALERGYLSGRYGAIPFLGNFEF